MRVLMVCLGNICRSPMAEGWLSHKSNMQQLDIEVDSAGIANYHIGSQADERMRKYAKKAGVSIDNLRARQFQVSDFDSFDRIFVMDKSNYKNVLALARTNADKEKVSLYLNELYPAQDLEVPDPYYDGEQAFNDVIALLEKATDAFIKNTFTK
jgi:protein-tyrosine phosphatase